LSYCRLGEYEPTYDEEMQILARIEAATGFQVALAGPWELTGGDPRYAGHSVKLLAFGKGGG
jgi:hypothetical protein